MLDGRGQVVITDFGLAGLADQIHGAEVRSGTPAYMAPEQLAGKEVSTRSDIYSLGPGALRDLHRQARLLREIPDEAADEHRAELSAGHRRWSRISIRSSSESFSAAWRTEPSARPATVLGVAAALPGGDPLAAALAAGETPSPQNGGGIRRDCRPAPANCRRLPRAAAAGFGFGCLLVDRITARWGR